MELIERPNLLAVKYLNSIPYDTFKQECIKDAEENGEKKPTDKDMKTWFSILQQFCKTNLKTKGITKRIYSYSQNTPAGLGGRLFSGGSLQGIWGVYRGLCMRGIGTDIDMSNCHPVLLRYICQKHNIRCPNLEYYINNRDLCLREFQTKAKGKTAYLIATNDDKRRKGANLPETFIKYDREMKTIQKQLVLLDDYKMLQETIPEYKLTKNYNGSVINRILCYYENIVLQHAIHVLNSKGIEIAILMFDGLMVYGDYYNNLELLQDIEEYVEEQMTGLNMKWAYKEHDNTLHIPDDYEEAEDDKTDENKFLKKVEEFEETNAKIINKSFFVQETPDEVIIRKKGDLITAYEHIEGKKEGGVPFINMWLRYEKMKKYDDIGVYPNPKLCPSNIFNMWRPFAMEAFTDDYEPNTTGLDIIKNHIRILCNNEEPVYDYFIKWVAQMIQYPEVKTIVPTLISKQGAGKGTFLKLMTKMLGNKKVLETTEPSRDVWGQFNGLMNNAFLVNLNELSKKETMESEGKIKGLITDPTLAINNKGKDQYQIVSHHRFIITTNKEDPIKTEKDDRRNLIIRSSDEKVGDKEYFNKINEYLEDINVIRTCYDYFKSIKDMDKFGLIPLPKTEYQENLKELYKSPIEMWLEDFTRTHYNEETVEKLGSEIFGEFEFWRRENNITYETNSVKLGIALANLKIKGITKGRHTRQGDTKYFNITLLKEHFSMGCLIDLKDEIDQPSP